MFHQQIQWHSLDTTLACHFPIAITLHAEFLATEQTEAAEPSLKPSPASKVQEGWLIVVGRVLLLQLLTPRTSRV